MQSFGVNREFPFLGWSLTLAGTYNDDMAPDVEMRLSFPKKNGNADVDTAVSNRKSAYKQENGNYQNFQREQSDVSNENYQLNNRAALPTTGSANMNPKRSLSKSVVGKNEIFSLQDFIRTFNRTGSKLQIKIEIYEIIICPIWVHSMEV